MKICFFGFAKMDYKGEEINDSYFLKKIIGELSSREVETFYLYKQYDTGLNEEEVFNQLSIQAERLCVDKYTEYPFKEYLSYSQNDLYEIIEFNHKLSLIKAGVDNRVSLLTTVIKALENIKEYDQKYNFDTFVFFGNTLISSTIRAYCKKNNKAYFNMENGYFRPFTLMVDSQGVNYESSIPRNAEFYHEISIDNDRLQKFLLKPEKAMQDNSEIRNYRKLFYDYYGIQLDEESDVTKGHNTKSGDHLTLPEEYIYVPFQLETDSQIIKHSPTVKTMKQLVEVTAAGLEKYNRDYNKNLKIIYKTHPLYLSELKVMDLDGIVRICRKNPDLIFLTEGNNKELVQNAKAVITINSTVGLEALIAHKPVLTLGRAFYNIKGISHVVENVEYLSGILAKALLEPVNTLLINKFLYYLRFHYFSEIYRSYPDDDSIKRLAGKIMRKQIN